jgi:hypothetical protein
MPAHSDVEHVAWIPVIHKCSGPEFCSRGKMQPKTGPEMNGGNLFLVLVQMESSLRGPRMGNGWSQITRAMGGSAERLVHSCSGQVS